MNSKSVLGVLGTAAATVVLVAACSGSSGTVTGASATPGATATTSATAAAHNAADVAFVRGMIPHHAQAVQMSEMAAQQASDEQVKQLATRIQQAQGPEIEQMRGLLAAWGEPDTGAAGTSGSMGGMDHGNMGHGGSATSMPMAQGMSGMMTEQQMQQMQQASGTQFDRMFLEMMTEHHNGAVQMARTELAQGQNPEAEALAQKIIDDQQAEITEMQQLLSTL
ncbi:DUF305 domain-containing protein [Pseudonocardia yuanmonensis]|uniref:DUF305 domain-containing protein n=1 Tax=Pseudonocardia yuanmonensis TaxID=1095914 RepID=A0ABP8WXJ3_9PSEU